MQSVDAFGASLTSLSHRLSLLPYRARRVCWVCWVDRVGSPIFPVSNKLKRISIGGAVVLLAAAATAPRSAFALSLAMGSLASSGEG